MAKVLFLRQTISYDWCTCEGLRSRHFRQIATESEDGTLLCQECSGWLVRCKGYIKVGPPPLIATIQEPAPEKFVAKKEKPSLPKRRFRPARREVLRERILELLSGGDGEVYTGEQFHSQVSDITRSQACIDSVLWDMRKKCQVASRPLLEFGRYAYTLPDKIYLIHERLGIKHHDHLLFLLDELNGQPLSVEQLGEFLKRPRGTVIRWINTFRQIGAILVRVERLPKRKGRLKLCWREPKKMMKESTKKLVTALEVRTEKARHPLYQEVLDRARSGYYHEFQSPIAFPITALVDDLTSLGLYDLVSRAREGEYDATHDEAKEWMQAEGKHLLL